MKEAKERLHPEPAVPPNQVEHQSIPRASCPVAVTTLESEEHQRHDGQKSGLANGDHQPDDLDFGVSARKHLKKTAISKHANVPTDAHALPAITT